MTTHQDVRGGHAPTAWRCPPGRKLPPFGRVLADSFLNGLMPANRQAVVHLDCWPPKNTAIGPAVSCPADTAPEALDWRILAGLDVLVRVLENCDGDRLRRLLRELVAVKPRRLIVVRPEAPHIEFIVTLANGQEVSP